MSNIVEGAKEALAMARGKKPAARLWIQGHPYVPEEEVTHLRKTLKIVDEYISQGKLSHAQMTIRIALHLAPIQKEEK